MNPPQDDDPMITQFRRVKFQWELNDDNIKRVEPRSGETILHNYYKCVNTTPLEVYRFLIETKGLDVNVRDNSQNTPLYHALRNFKADEGDITVLAYLFGQKTTDVNIKALRGQTLLHTACVNINSLPLRIFKVILETHGGDINIRDNAKDTPLHHALRNFKSNLGDIATLTYLFNQDSLDVTIKGQFGVTLLHTACQHLSSLPLEVFKCLIETQSADVNAQDDANRYTPLHYAFSDLQPEYNIAILTYLLNREGINVSIRGQDNLTPLHLACHKINILTLDIFKILIEIKGGDVNARFDFSEFTPIRYALTSFSLDHGGNVDILIYLFSQKSVDVNAKDKNGYNLLHYASFNINSFPLKLFEYLIETKGGDIGIPDNNHHTPLYWSVCNFRPGNNASALTYLLSQKGVSSFVNTQGQNGLTLLHAASQNINSIPLEAFKCLESQGADFNAQDRQNNTPSHLALQHFKPDRNGDVTTLKYLLGHNRVNANLQDDHGRTLLHQACISSTLGPVLWGQTKPSTQDDLDTLWCAIIETITHRSLEQILQETMF
jgi:ankyrin repeat protein